MTCSCVFSPRRKTRGARHPSDRVAARRVEVNKDGTIDIDGTWDYKWPIGTNIRVAFQMPPKGTATIDEFEKARKLVENLVSLWEVLQPKPLDPKLAERISIEFSNFAPLPPPLQGGEFRLVGHRSPFTDADPVERNYDVLVSMQDLPVRRMDALAPQGPTKNDVAFPIADLGSYARRADYGEPTVYIGRLGNYADGDEKVPLSEYYELPLAKHIVVHEFGHVLGLAHTHQDPAISETERRATFKEPEAVRKLIEELVGVPPSDELLDAHLYESWDGNPGFSDWPEQVQPLKEMDSVMTFPYAPQILREPGLGSAMLAKPSASDIKLLRDMYGA